MEKKQLAEILLKIHVFKLNMLGNKSNLLLMIKFNSQGKVNREENSNRLQGDRLADSIYREVA